MVEQTEELKKLADIAGNLALSPEVRARAIELLGHIGSYAALRVLLDLAAKRDLDSADRVLALKKATEIVRAGHGREPAAD